MRVIADFLCLVYSHRREVIAESQEETLKSFFREGMTPLVPAAVEAPGLLSAVVD